MNNEEYLSSLSKKRFYRVFARVCLLIILVLAITTVVLCVTKSPYYLPVLLITIITPVFMYIILWLGKVLGTSENDNQVSAGTDVADEGNKNK